MVRKLVVLSAVTALCTSNVHAQQPLPINSQPFGKSYGEWTVAYWQWALGIPFAQNPWANDPTGAFAAVGQTGPVWFLGGTLGSSAERTLTIPLGKAIFMPINQWIFGATVFDCEPSNPGVVCDVPTLQAAAATNATASTTLEVTVDGNAVQGFRATSPGAFNVTLPAGNVPEVGFGAPTPAGTYGPHVSDGYWLMLSAASAGEHTITVHVVNPFAGEYFITYHITVQGRSHFAPASVTTGKPGDSDPVAPVARRTSWGKVKAYYH
jgi:hypothetical protein